jgi:hypothetical protein
MRSDLLPVLACCYVLVCDFCFGTGCVVFIGSVLCMILDKTVVTNAGGSVLALRLLCFCIGFACEWDCGRYQCSNLILAGCARLESAPVLADLNCLWYTGTGISEVRALSGLPGLVLT